ncbi:MAG: glycosyltransferase [Acidobacteria bacterium]|nr:glycosyltransferase [Acidobacteriota bacterium]
MRVLHFLDTLGRGGAEMQALDVARNAADHGIDLTVAAGGGGGLESAFRDSGVEVVRLQRRLPVDPFLALNIRRIIKERQIEIVHGYQPVDGIHLWLAASGLANVRKVLSFQGFIQDRKNRAAAKFVIPRMDANIVVSRGLQEWLREKDNLETSKKFSLIYNGADPKRLVSGGQFTSCRTRH